MKAIYFFNLILVFSMSASGLEFNTARTLGFADVGSVNASSSGLNMKHNPAALSLNADLEFGAGYGRGELLTDIDQKVYYAWAKDSISSSFKTKRNNAVKGSMGQEKLFPFAAALMFNKYKIDQADYKSYQLSISRVLGRKLSFGGTVKRLDGELLGSDFEKWVGDLGVVYRKSKKIHGGLSWINLNGSDDFEERLRLGGAFYVSELARLFFDVDYSLEDVSDEWSFGGGFEAQLREFFAFRSGYFLGGSSKPNCLGLGFSFMGPKLKIHYGVKVEMDSKAALHSVDFSLPLW